MTDTDLLSDIQTVLMEAPDGGLTYPSGLWTPEEILHRLNERGNRFLTTTHCVVVEGAPIPVSAGQSRVALPQDWLATLSLYWYGQDGVTRELSRVDSFEMDHGDPTWEYTRGVPRTYQDYDAPVLVVAIGPVPAVNGVLVPLYVAQGFPMDGTGNPLTVPEVSYTALKYGTLADAFGKDGRGADPTRATYCEMRYALDQQIANIILLGWV
jgi:hypothetical protein